MNTNDMVEKLTYGETALCISGCFEGISATKLGNGLVVLVEKDITFDFWDTRFSNCEWSF